MGTKHVPVRTCIACRSKGPKSDFARLVLSPEGEVRIDPPRRVPGRGAYLCRRLECWEEGLRGGRLRNALKGSVPAEARERLLASAREWYDRNEHSRDDSSELLNR